MNRFARLTIASRVFCVAVILGLSLALVDPIAIQSTILLAALSSTAIAAELISRLPAAWVAVAEAALAALVVGLVLPQGFVLLPYLVVPALIAGVTRGVIPVILVVIAEVAAMALLILPTGGWDELNGYTEIVAPWLLTSLGVGLLGIWLRQIRGGPASLVPDPSYESAHRLLSQLRTVARRLSAGLDTVSMSGQLLSTVHDRLNDTHSAVFVRTEGGVLAPINYRGPQAREDLNPDGQVIKSCWAEMEPTHTVRASLSADRRHRTALPLRVGSRMIGVVLLDAAKPPSSEGLSSLMAELDEHSLRLDTALAFDEVRSIATMEERQRLAREIHDGVAQEIASLGYAVDELSASATNDHQRAGLGDLRGELTRVVSELRLSIFDLRSEINPSAGLGSALSDYVRQVGSRSEMTVHLTLDEAPTRLRSEVETELLRIAQEAITNARKHSRAQNLWVDCRTRPPYARVEVRDDGSGRSEGREDSYGLRIMRERAKRINATLQISDGAVQDATTGTSVLVAVGDEPIPEVANAFEG